MDYSLSDAETVAHYNRLIAEDRFDEISKELRQAAIYARKRLEYCLKDKLQKVIREEEIRYEDLTVSETIMLASWPVQAVYIAKYNAFGHRIGITPR